MSAQLELPEEFTLPASAGEQDKELCFRRDYELGGVTHRARIGPLISTVILTSPSAAEKPSSQVSSTSPIMDETEEEMSPTKNDVTSLKGELVEIQALKNIRERIFRGGHRFDSIRGNGERSRGGMNETARR